MRSTLPLALALLIGVGTGHLLSALRAPPRAEEPAAPVVAAPKVAPDLALVRAEVRRALAEEAPSREATAPAACEPALDREAVEPTTEQATAHERARTLVSSALGPGVWTAEDAMKMRGLLGQLPDRERDEVLRMLLPAINEGRLQLAGDAHLAF